MIGLSVALDLRIVYSVLSKDSTLGKGISYCLQKFYGAGAVVALTFFINDAKPLGPSTCSTVLQVSKGVNITLHRPAKRLAIHVVNVTETCLWRVDCTSLEGGGKKLL